MTNKKPEANLEGLISERFETGTAQDREHEQRSSPFGRGNATDAWADHQREKELLDLEAKLKREESDQKHKQAMEVREKRHARHMNIGAATFIALLVSIISILLALVSLDISIPWLGITGSNNSEVKKLAISSLGPLSGLSIGFFSGKIKWPG